MSDELRGYDAWKTTPPDDDTIDCPECEGTGKALDTHPADGDRAAWTEEITCETCDGTGRRLSPDAEDIAERRADEQLSDPDFNRSTGRYD